MNNERTIKAPHTIEFRDKQYPTIFLAGSIEMGVAENWQETIDNPQFKEQVVWELNALDKAS